MMCGLQNNWSGIHRGSEDLHDEGSATDGSQQHPTDTVWQRHRGYHCPNLYGSPPLEKETHQGFVSQRRVRMKPGVLLKEPAPQDFTDRTPVSSRH